MHSCRRSREVTLFGDHEKVLELTQLHSLTIPLGVMTNIGWTNESERPRLGDMANTDHPHTAGPDTAPAAASQINQRDLPGSPDARRFIGAAHSDLPISLFLVDDPPGAGPLMHRHPYPELFIVHSGHAEFQIDEMRLIAMTGDILIAPAASAHRFTNIGHARLRVTAIHTAPRMETEWLEEPTSEEATC